MRLESLELEKLALRVEADDFEEWEILRKISSLAMVAYDCAVSSILLRPPPALGTDSLRAVEALVERNPVIRLTREVADTERNEFGFVVVCREQGFICLRHADDRNHYAIYVEGVERNVDLASRISYIIANLLGFSTLLSFEVRFGLYELLSNIVEHGLKEDGRQWVQISLQRKVDKLNVSIVDKGMAFDPTEAAEFDLAAYLRGGRRRGLGLIMTRKIAEQLLYRRECGHNKTFFEKSMPSLGRNRKENAMSRFEIESSRTVRDGARLFLLSGDLDTKGALVIEDLIEQLLEENILKAILDFDKVAFVSSAGVGVLLGLVSTIREKGGEVFFVNLSPKVKSVFGLLNLDDYFKVLEEEAFTG
ncbi:MAG TPA: STAS domain-containing protein [Candidatus Eisenbacteria bacterium]|uniref:Anti-sigma factor antagonist n=1 Tax=Eiseniibacteriota bacterium TaxID=2212470 RepID=A0A7V2AUG5_UNCEI|nr:STAS domain-containing protein [Candidatus Eisenbacteria bacterium]